MKKTAALLLGLYLCCALPGCGPARTGTQSAPAQPAGSPDAESGVFAEAAGPPSNEASPAPETPACFFVPAMNEEQQAMYSEYARPLLLTGLLLNDWSAEDPSAISFIPEQSSGTALIFAYEDLVGQERMRALWDKYGETLPAGEIEPLLLARFPFSAEQLHEILSNYYRPGLDAYEYEGGRGGGPVEGAVTGIETGENGALLVDYAVFAGYADEFTTPEHDAYMIRTSGTLTLTPKEDGTMRWNSVKVNEKLDGYDRE